MSRFPWQIFTRVVLVQSIIVMLAIGGSALTARHFFKRQFIAQVEGQLHDTLVALNADIPARGAPSPIHGSWCRDHSIHTSFRLTAIRLDGVVICDSQHDAREMENHRDRPEVVEAMLRGYGEDLRYSATTGEETLYAALGLSDKHLVIRAGYPLARLNAILHLLDTSIVLFLLVIASALGLFAIWAGRMLVFPIGRLLIKTQSVLNHGAQGSSADLLGPMDPLRDETYGEWGELESSIDEIRRDLMAKAESLSVEREELATLMGAISDAILAVDKEGKPLFFNSRFALLFGNQQALRDRSVRLWEMFRVPEILEAFKGALNLGQIGSVNAVPLEREGENKRFFAVSVSPLRKQSGAIYGAVGIFHDVTELKSAEQIRIDFVANVSHELRTPLTSIKGYTDTILLDVQDGRPVAKEFLDIIARNVERLMNLIRDLLDLSALESTDVLHKSAISTAEITARVIGQLQGAFAAKGQKIVERVDASLVMADPRRVEQVLTNLLENANKYTPAGGEIRVSWENERNAVLLRISDNGPGIPPEHHARLFERFYRVDKARSRDQGGTGLGLAIVKHIMQRHDGSVWVDSQAGQGSSFICRFPG
jgi:two-component system phosphate regulon sensor histidine kinase PhoR